MALLVVGPVAEDDAALAVERHAVLGIGQVLRGEPEVEAVARWHSVNRSLHALWLDSGEYEGWARARLLDWSGQVNQDGMKVARMLSARLPTCVWLFRDSEGDFDKGEVVVDCPICGKPLEKNVKYGSGKCLECHVLP